MVSLQTEQTQKQKQTDSYVQCLVSTDSSDQKMLYALQDVEAAGGGPGGGGEPRAGRGAGLHQGHHGEPPLLLPTGLQQGPLIQQNFNEAFFNKLCLSTLFIF